MLANRLLLAAFELGAGDKCGAALPAGFGDVQSPRALVAQHHADFQDLRGDVLQHAGDDVDQAVPRFDVKNALSHVIILLVYFFPGFQPGVFFWGGNGQL